MSTEKRRTAWVMVPVKVDIQEDDSGIHVVGVTTPSSDLVEASMGVYGEHTTQAGAVLAAEAKA